MGAASCRRELGAGSACLVADGAEGDFLTDVQDVVADTLKVGEHLGVEHTALVRAGAGLHPVDLSLAEIFGHVVDLLLDLLDFLDVAAVLLDTQHHIQRLIADLLHLADLLDDLGGKADLLLLNHVGVFADVHCVVADALQVAADLKQHAHVLRILRVALLDQHAGNVFGNFLVQKVDVFLAVAHLLQQAGVAFADGIEAERDVFFCHLGHAGQLVADCVDGNGGDTDLGFASGLNRNHGLDVLQMHGVFLLLRAVRKDLGRHFCQLCAEWQQQQGGGDVEDGVGVRNLSRYVWRQALHQRNKWRYHADDGEDNGADDVKGKVDDGGALGVAAGADGRQHCRDAGTDVLAEQDINRLRKADNAAGSQRLQDTDRSGGRLDDRGEDCACQDAQNRIGELGHQRDEGFGLTQRHHRGAHHVHADEQDAQTGNDLAEVVQLLLLEKNNHRHTDKGEQRGDGADVQRNQLTGDGGADVGAHDDPHRLLQGHHARVDKADNHDGGGRRGLNDGGDTGSHQYAQDAVCGQTFQNAFHLVAGGGFQAVAHHLHAVQEKAQTAQQTN